MLVPFLLATAVAVQSHRADTTRLHDIVVTATRIPTPAARTGSSGDVLGPAELRRRGRHTVAEALQLVAGAAPSAGGASGSITSVFLRGVASSQTLVLIDGIRQNDANLSAAALLGGVGLDGVARLEVVRGPQSTLYGGAAIGGVIALDARPGSGPLRGDLTMEGGSLGTWRTQAGFEGSRRNTGVSGAVTADGTENQRPGNRWRQRTEFLRLDQRLGGGLSAGAGFRGLQQEYQSPGDIRDVNTTPGLATSFENHLVTAWIEAAPPGPWQSRLLLGYQQQFNASTGRWNGGPDSRYTLRGDRWVVDWLHRIELAPGIRGMAGLNREWSTVASDGTPHDERLLAVHAGLQADPIPAISLGAGIRRDDYSSFGAAVTWRLTAAWRPGPATRVHASFGTGFMPPGLLARYGSVYQSPNPAIRAERARGWDAGVDRTLAGGRITAGVTWFHDTLRDLIGWKSAPWPALGQSVNIDAAGTSGLEVTGRFVVGPADFRLAWTGLSARSAGAGDSAGSRLIRRPGHTVAVDVVVEVTRRIAVGAGVLVVADRIDTDFNVFPAASVAPGDYAVLRAHGSWQAGGRLELRLRTENLLGARYEPVYGFPAPGRTVTSSLAFRL